MSVNGSPVTRAELAAHILRIDESLNFMRSDIAEIRDAVTAPRRWLGDRLNKLLDYTLVGVAAFVAALIATHL